MTFSDDPHTPLPPGHTYYQPRLKWTSPPNLSPIQIARLLVEQWNRHRDIARRYGIPIDEQSCLDDVRNYVSALLPHEHTIQILSPTIPVEDSKPKADKCCGQS